jgi:hypothetical protein
MQNKANFLDIQMNVTSVKTKSYELRTMNYEPTKQTQSNPIYGEHRRTIYGELVEPANFYTKNSAHRL